MIADYEQRAIDLANRLHGMTFAEWERVKFLIDRKFESQKEELEHTLQLSVLDEKGF